MLLDFLLLTSSPRSSDVRIVRDTTGTATKEHLCSRSFSDLASSPLYSVGLLLLHDKYSPSIISFVRLLSINILNFIIVAHLRWATIIKLVMSVCVSVCVCLCICLSVSSLAPTIF